MSEQIADLPADIVAYINSCRHKRHGESYVISVLQMIQTQFGYLSRAHMDAVAYLMDIPTAKVAGIATFYHFFSFVPKGQYRVTVCMGTACFVRGADKVLERLKEELGVAEGATTPDGRFSLQCARCIGACALAPVMLVNDKVYGNVQPDDVVRILAEYGHKARKVMVGAK